MRNSSALTVATLHLLQAGELERGLEVALRLLWVAREGGARPADLLPHLEEVAEFAFRLEQFEVAIEARLEMLEHHALLAAQEPSEAQVEDLTWLGYYHLLASEEDTLGNHEEQSAEWLSRAEELIVRLPSAERREYPALYLTLAHLARWQRDPQRAMKHLEEAWRLHQRYDPRDGGFCLQLHRLRILLLYALGDLPKARKACRIALRWFDDPEFPPQNYPTLSHLHYLQGRLHERDGQVAQARQSFERAVDLLRRSPRRYPAMQQRALERCLAAMV